MVRCEKPVLLWEREKDETYTCTIRYIHVIDNNCVRPALIRLTKVNPDYISTIVGVDITILEQDFGLVRLPESEDLINCLVAYENLNDSYKLRELN